MDDSKQTYDNYMNGAGLHAFSEIGMYAEAPRMGLIEVVDDGPYIPPVPRKPLTRTEKFMKFADAVMDITIGEILSFIFRVLMFLICLGAFLGLFYLQAKYGDGEIHGWMYMPGGGPGGSGGFMMPY